MHNNIMAAGSRDRPPMLATGRYAQWRSRFLRYINTRPNGDALRKCILKGPYTSTTITTPVVPTTEDSPAVPEQTIVEIVMNMTPKNIAHFESEKEAIHLILTGIRDEIYSTVDACQTAQEMWEAIERLQQVNELRAKRMAKNANPLALVATAQTLQDPYYKCKKMKLSQDMQLIQKLRHDQKRMKKVFEVMSEGTWYPKDSGFELTAFSDADLAGCLDTRKALLEGDHSLGDKLIRWVGWGQLADKVYESLPENGLSILSEDSHKVVRLGINPMIQPEPEDLPKDNPKLEIAVLRYVVPTGRVIATVSIKVPTGRYIVPAGYIISPSRVT
ncbi:hypothetical protein Tco_1041740 [Tanacetum coccineum]|uniref:Uncharacterized protein n=1 Tax=Tanacetum coccineum TaxID=301880 RepID=A0ABQ5GIF1_9ASTR